MTESAPFTPLQDLSTALASLVASTAPSVTAVQSHRSRSGFVWRPGLIVTADEALSEDGEYAVTLSGGHTVPAQPVGRDPSTDVALLRVDRSDLRPRPRGVPPLFCYSITSSARASSIGGHTAHSRAVIEALPECIFEAHAGAMASDDDGT
jgi:Trypsin-like peptidase domain